MAGRKKRGNSDNSIEAYRHETDKRKNVVPVGLAYYDTSKPKPDLFAKPKIL